jgi:uncharacterized protein
MYEGVDGKPTLFFRAKSLRWEICKFPYWILKCALKSSGLFERGYRNALDLKIKDRILEVNGLPKELQGLRILFMSDLHFQGMPGLTDLIIERLHQVKVDLCLFGGDFQCSQNKFIDPVVDGMQRIVDSVEAPMGFYAVLGNHDTLDLVAEFEKIGIRMLMNESICLKKRSLSFFVVGVDDPYFHGFHDLDKAFENVPSKAFKIFLAHTPELYNQAWQKGANCYLSGHTHNGQIQLPYFGPLVTHSSIPKKLVGGTWKYEDMTGFTGPGVGTSGAPVRFLCPPEITILELKAYNNKED